jgi:hypothetical protein
LNNASRYFNIIFFKIQVLHILSEFFGLSATSTRGYAACESGYTNLKNGTTVYVPKLPRNVLGQIQKISYLIAKQIFITRPSAKEPCKENVEYE